MTIIRAAAYADVQFIHIVDSIVGGLGTEGTRARLDVRGGDAKIIGIRRSIILGSRQVGQSRGDVFDYGRGRRGSV